MSFGPGTIIGIWASPVKRDIRAYIEFTLAVDFKNYDSDLDTPPHQLFLILQLLSHVFRIKFKLLRTFIKEDKLVI